MLSQKSQNNVKKILIRSGLDIPDHDGIEEIKLKCPLHEDNNPSFGLNLKSGLWHCFAGCGGGNIRTLLVKLLNVTDIEASRLIRAGEGIGSEIETFQNLLVGINSRNNDNYSPKGFTELPIVSNLRYNKSSSFLPPQILERGFKEETLLDWRCGLNLKGNSLLIPIDDENNRLVGCVERRIDGTMPKYWYTEGFSKSMVIFGLGKYYSNRNWYEENSKNYLIITEGPLDTIWLYQNGYPAISILGVHLSYYQEYLLRKINIREFVVCLDNDKAGKFGTKRIKDKLEKYGLISTVFLPDEVNDIQDVRDSRLISKIIDNRDYLM